MIWIGMILAMTWAQSVQGWSEWGFRITVLSSLGANLVVAILSGTRRRLASGRLRQWLGQLAKLCLWLACQVAEAATTNAIGSLSLCGSDASEEEKQVVAFWATFLLLHLGGPDNLTAYAPEENKMSSRKWIEMFYRILGVIYAIYNNTHRGGRSWALLPAASAVMLLAGAVRYFETVIALGKANLDSMQEDASDSTSNSKQGDVDVNKKMGSLKSIIERTKRRGRWLRDGEALLLAQDLFPIWRHALVDSSVNPDSPRQQASEMMLSDEWHWESMCKVAEMELSLIYEFLYTKAILAQTWTWCYYLIRLFSPLFTAAATFLFYFWHHLHPEQQQQQVRGSYVRITYALLVITFLMDVAWLLRALGSTWAYSYLREQAPAWLRHQALHASGRRWWCRLNRTVIHLDPLRLFCLDPVSHRRWSGTIGQYNFLDECTATTTTCWSQCPEWWPWSEAGEDRPKEMRYLSELDQCVKEALFERVRRILKEAIDKDKEDGEKKDKDMYTRQDIRTQWGQKAWSRAVGKGKIKSLRKGKDSIFGKEFEEDVLMWHIATSMVLPHIPQNGRHTSEIEVMSEYMMFLVAVRRQMLPGLVLHSQLQVTREKLAEIWLKRSKILHAVERLRINNKEKLAMILRLVRTREDTKKQWTNEVIQGTEGTRLLAHAVDLYFYLSGEDPRVKVDQHGAVVPPSVPANVPEVIFNVWVDKLVYAAVRCSREAHAKQLSAGGDLTTVLWMLIQHAGPFCMGEAPDIHFASLPEEKKKPEEKKQPDYKKPEEKKKKEEEEKKKKDKPEEKKDKPEEPPRRPVFEPPTMLGLPPMPVFPPPAVAGFPPLPPPYCPMCPPCFHPSYPPVCPPYYDPSWRPVCPWCPQCPPQHENPGDKAEASRGDEGKDSSSDEDSEE